MDRRSFLASLSAALAFQSMRSLHLSAQTTSFQTDPFALGIASGEPMADSVILWTRLVPNVMAADYGLSQTPVPVQWEIAEDSSMKKIVGKGTLAATPELNHSVHVEAKGLKPHREYFYRFHAGGATSPVGRTKTAPAANDSIDKLRFAFASCQSYGAGYYLAHRDMARQDLDVVLFLGDYIYEHNPKLAKAGVVRKWDYNSPNTIFTLDDYRRQYTMYKTDADLQACHAAHPWVVTPDDHEVENNWAGDHSEHENLAKLKERRAAAYQAYYENTPLRASSMPKGSQMQLYRELNYGKLAQFFILDTRQYRTPQPCGDKRKPHCEERLAPNATIMGSQQEAWLAQRMTASKAQWNIVGHQTLISQVAYETPEGPAYSTDNWDGYAAARTRLTNFLGSAKPRNPVFVAGDIHRTCVSDLKADYNNPKSAIVASEITGTSVSSGGDGIDHTKGDAKTEADNPHLVYQNHKRGYFISELTPKQMKSELRTADKISDRNAAVSKTATFIVENNKKGIHKA